MLGFRLARGLMAAFALDRSSLFARLLGRAMPAPDKVPTGYRMAKKDDKGEIYLYGPVGSSWWMDGVSATKFKDDLKALGAVKTIDLHINSEGGDVFDGRAIYSQLVGHGARIVVHVDGLAASIASLIAMAGDEIRMADGTFIMVHNAWGVGVGNAAEMERMRELLLQIDNTLLDTYERRTRQKRADLQKWMDAETWFDAKQAQEKGFCDVVDEPVAAAARIERPDLFANLPAALSPKRRAAAAAIARMRAACPKK